MDRRNLRLLLVLAALSSVMLLAFSLGLIAPVVFYAAPALLLAAPLLAGRFIGEETIHRLAARRRPRRTAVRGTAALVPRLRHTVAGVSGGLLVAASLAGRAPPAALSR